MQFRVLSALVIFLSSYLPLSLILLAQDIDYTKEFYFNLSEQGIEWQNPFMNPAFSLSIFALCLFCFIVMLFTLASVQRKRSLVVTHAKHVPAELMNYTLPYVVAFMSIGYQDTDKFIGFSVFLLWMFWITYRSGQIILNPLLIAVGWRLYDVKYYRLGESKKEHPGQLLSNSDITTGETYPYTAIQDVLIVKPKKGKE